MFNRSSHDMTLQKQNNTLTSFRNIVPVFNCLYSGSNTQTPAVLQYHRDPRCWKSSIVQPWWIQSFIHNTPVWKRPCSANKIQNALHIFKRPVHKMSSGGKTHSKKLIFLFLIVSDRNQYYLILYTILYTRIWLKGKRCKTRWDKGCIHFSCHR